MSVHFIYLKLPPVEQIPLQAPPVHLLFNTLQGHMVEQWPFIYIFPTQAMPL